MKSGASELSGAPDSVFATTLLPVLRKTLFGFVGRPWGGPRGDPLRVRVGGAAAVDYHPPVTAPQRSEPRRHVGGMGALVGRSWSRSLADRFADYAAWWR